MSDHYCFFNGGHLQCPPGWERKPHSHSFYQLIIVYSGEMAVEIGGNKFTARPGDLVFYGEEAPHREWNEIDIPLEIIYLDWEGPDPELPAYIKDNRGRVRIMAEWLLDDFKTSQYSRIDDNTDSLIQSLILEVMKNASFEENDFIHKVKSMIADNLEEELSLESLAGYFGMNKYTFLRKYKKLSDKTPIDEVRRIRLEKARDLIISTDLPLKEIAVITGLSNEQHLSRIFTRYLKVPPGYFRKNH